MHHRRTKKISTYFRLFRLASNEKEMNVHLAARSTISFGVPEACRITSCWMVVMASRGDNINAATMSMAQQQRVMVALCSCVHTCGRKPRQWHNERSGRRFQSLLLREKEIFKKFLILLPSKQASRAKLIYTNSTLSTSLVQNTTPFILVVVSGPRRHYITKYWKDLNTVSLFQRR